MAGARRGILLAIAAAAVGLALQIDAARWNSATYDEPTYLRVASRWWRSGDQEQITRMGSPLTFWKLQHAPVFLALDAAGRGGLVDEADGRIQELLPMVRIGALWIWLTALIATAWWSRRLYGRRAMICAAWLFALSPNLIAHGALATMETPLAASTAVLFALFWKFLETGRRRWFWGSALVCGLAWSCKFTAVLYPPILGLAWWLDRRRGEGLPLVPRTVRVISGTAAFILVALAADFAVTGGAALPLSPTRLDHPSLIDRFGPVWGRRLALLYETPLPQDWVGFATQTRHQAGGGPSYLFGERRMRGWWYYYFVALAVKTPPTLFVLIAARSVLAWRDWRRNRAAPPDPPDDAGRRPPRDGLIPVALTAFLILTAVGSSRNYGVRYLLPLAPLAVVWLSALAEVPRWNRLWVPIGLIGAAWGTAAVHPFELTYFNAIAGGPIGGRRILSDSNLDWGQGLLALARLQREEPEFRDLTLYYFGDVDPDRYGIVGPRSVITAVGGAEGLPRLDELRTRYVGVSASLQWGPWGPPGFFDRLHGIAPIRLTDDATIAVYRAADVPAAAVPNRDPAGPIGRFGATFPSRGLEEVHPVGEAVFETVGQSRDVSDEPARVD